MLLGKQCRAVGRCIVSYDDLIWLVPWPHRTANGREATEYPSLFIVRRDDERNHERALSMVRRGVDLHRARSDRRLVPECNSSTQGGLAKLFRSRGKSHVQICS